MKKTTTIKRKKVARANVSAIIAANEAIEKPTEKAVSTTAKAVQKPAAKAVQKPAAKAVQKPAENSPVEPVERNFKPYQYASMPETAITGRARIRRVDLPTENVKNEFSFFGVVKSGESVKTIAVKTDCNTFGNCKIDEYGNFQMVGKFEKCRTCPTDVKSACIVKNNPAILPVASKSKENFIGARVSVNEKHRSIKDFVTFMLEQGKYTRAQIIAEFYRQFPTANKTQGGRYVSSAFNAKYSYKRHGGIAVKNDKGVISLIKGKP